MKNRQLLFGPITRPLCWLFDGVVIGSAAKAAAESKDIANPTAYKDIDIIIPLDRWVEASKLIPRGARANCFGGFKFREGRTEFDVWADDVMRVFAASDSEFLFVPKTGLLIKKTEAKPDSSGLDRFGQPLDKGYEDWEEE